LNCGSPGPTIIRDSALAPFGIPMLVWHAHGDGEEFLLILIVGTVIGALCGAVPLTVGLIRGNKSMAWTAFGVCVLIGLALLPAALLPAIVFTIIVAVTEPIEKGRKKRREPRRRRRERADDLLDDDFGPKRKRDDDDDYRRRRRRRQEEEDEDYDRPRGRRRRYDD